MRTGPGLSVRGELGPGPGLSVRIRARIECEARARIECEDQAYEEVSGLGSEADQAWIAIVDNAGVGGRGNLG